MHGDQLITGSVFATGENLGVADTDELELAGLGHDALLQEMSRVIATLYEAHRSTCIGSILQL
jgi:hypothetical protein